MVRRKRKTKSADLVVLVSGYSVLWYVYSPVVPELSMILIGISAVLIWICFLVPTYCDYRTQQNRPCTRGVRGKLRGCHDHSRLKRDAMFAAFRLRNPGMLFRIMWSAPSQATPGPPQTVGSSGPGTAPAKPTKQSANDMAMLYLTVISTAATVVALFK